MNGELNLTPCVVISDPKMNVIYFYKLLWTKPICPKYVLKNKGKFSPEGEKCVNHKDIMKDKTGILTSFAKPKTKFFEELLSEKKEQMYKISWNAVTMSSGTICTKPKAASVHVGHRIKRLISEMCFRRYCQVRHFPGMPSRRALNHLNCLIPILTDARWMKLSQHWTSICALTGERNSEKNATWIALTCNCPTPFPLLNALSNHRRDCC